MITPYKKKFNEESSDFKEMATKLVKDLDKKYNAELTKIYLDIQHSMEDIIEKGFSMRDFEKFEENSTGATLTEDFILHMMSFIVNE
jgi:hypothetical protein